MVSCKTPSKILQEAMQLPGGARFYKCALQVNPFVYQQDFKNGTQASSYQTEEEYNTAIINACQKYQIEVIAVTDHNRVQGSLKLSQVAREAGIFVFSGFEATSKDGVHYLCLFDPEKESMLERVLGECGFYNSDGTAALSTLDSLELIDCIQLKGGICIAAHACSKGGILKTLPGQSKINVWTSKLLLAAAIPGSIEEAPQEHRSILNNTDGQHKRERNIAIVNANDANSPEDLALPRSSCLIKMSKPSVEALRQAFLDPDSRIRLHSTPDPEDHTEFLAMAWESGGFIEGTKLRFNENLNVLIGGRGAGKSTVIESLRYVLGLTPLGDEAQKAHASIVKYVLGAGTKISLLVRSHHPSLRCYTIERTIPNPPVVKDEDGEILTLLPKDVVPGVEIYGQHEVSELTKDRTKLTNLLKRFIDSSGNTQQQKTTILLELERSRGKILQVDREIRAIEERLAALPTLEETLKRFVEAGLEDKLKEKSLLIKEQSILGSIKERFEPFHELYQGLAQSLPIDKAFLSEKSLENLPNKILLEQGNEILSQAERKFISILETMKASLDETEQKISALQGKWNENRLNAEARYEKILRDLQREKIDAQQFIDLQVKILALRPLRDKLNNFIAERNSLIKSRTKSLNEWQEIQRVEFQALQAAEKKIENNKNKQIKNRIKVKPHMAADRSPLERLLREEIGGNLTALMERIKARESFSVVDFVTRCREGKDALMSHYSLPQAVSEKLAQAGEELFMKIEEIDLPASTEIKLNTASDGEDEDWHTLEQLSTGQKATAVLLLLLLESEAPLIVDQPEDDLDNRFITDGIVPTMREEKRKRQFIFSTHNANIPVLGDAEMILGLSTNAQDGGAHGRINPEHMASIDAAPIRELVGTILEGGKIAFEMRRERYGF